MITSIFLSEQECYCEIDQFYTNVAKHLGYDIPYDDDIHKFNCTKICITPSIFSKIKEYYMREHNDNECFVTLLFAAAGPKMTVNEFPNNHYIAEVENGFVVEDIKK